MKKLAYPWMTHPFFRAAVLGVAIVSGVSCRAETRSHNEKSRDSTLVKSAPVSPAAGQYTPVDFAHLGWLVGSWRGRLPDGGSFYERYRLLDDSTIAMRGYADSTFARATDSARITLRAGTVAEFGQRGLRGGGCCQHRHRQQ